MLKGFRQFILRGNVLDLSVGIIIGAAFNSVVSALVKDVITPFIGSIFTLTEFSSFTVTIHGSTFLFGDFLNNVITFFIDAATVYFFVVLPANTLMKKFQKGQPQEVTTRPCPECLSNIPKDARRCAYCTAAVEPERAGSGASAV